MPISVIEVSNRRAQLLKAKATKKLKELRRETRSAMQRYEGETDLCEVEQETYDDLNMSMVILNAISDHVIRHDVLPKSWDEFTLGSKFEKEFTPLLRSNEEGDLWVDYFDFDRPEDLMRFVVGNAAAVFTKQTTPTPQRPTMKAQPAQQTQQARQPEPKAAEASGAGESLMDMIRARMPSSGQTHYSPKRT